MLAPYLLLLARLALPTDELSLYETAPIETALDDPALPEASDVWRGAIEAAQVRIELAHFYASAGEGGAAARRRARPQRATRVISAAPRTLLACRCRLFACGSGHSLPSRE